MSHESEMKNQPAGVPEPEETPADSSRGADRALVAAWMTSLVIHVVLFALMVAIPWIARSAGGNEAQASATAGLQSGPKDAKFTIYEGQSSFSKPAKLEQSKSKHIRPEQGNTLRELSHAGRPALSIVGIGTGGGEFSKYGLRAGLGKGGPEFFGLGGEARAARKIVYVCDRSGSMIAVIADLQKELKRSINGLRKSQKFHLIFYSSGPPVENAPRRLVNAIRASKDEAFQFIDQVTAAGGTDPMEAMQRAFQLKPDLIYFLSDGEIPAAQELLENLNQWNRGRRVRIYTIAYVNPTGRHLLEEIAREHNGRFRYVSEYDLE